MFTLHSLNTSHLNGVNVTIMDFHSEKNRFKVKLLDTDKKILVKRENIKTNQELDICAICQEEMFPFTSRTLGCNHSFHYDCIKKWRSTASGPFNHENPAARCPTCRSFEGLAMHTDWNRSGDELISLAMGYIYQKHATLNNKPEPSFEDELTFVTASIFKVLQNHPQIYDRISKATKPIQNPKGITISEIKTIRIAFVSVIGIHLKYMNESLDEWKPAIEAWLKASGIPNV